MGRCGRAYTIVVGRLQRLGRIGRPSPSVQRLLERRFPLCVAMALARVALARRGTGPGAHWPGTGPAWHWPSVALARRGTGPSWHGTGPLGHTTAQQCSRHAAELERPGSDGHSTATPTVPIFPFKAPTIVVAVPVLAFKAPTIVVAVLITDRPGGTPAVHACLACTFGVAVVLSDDGVQRCQLALRPARRDACDTAPWAIPRRHGIPRIQCQLIAGRKPSGPRGHLKARWPPKAH